MTLLTLAACAPDDVETDPEPEATAEETVTETAEAQEPDDDEPEATETVTEEPSPEPEDTEQPEETDAAPKDDEIEDPASDFSLDPQRSPNWEGFQPEPSHDVLQVLSEVRFGQHEGFERAVLEYSGPQELAYEVHYVEPATDVRASTQLLVTVLGASTGPQSQEQAYTGIAYPELDDTVFIEAQARAPEAEVVIGLKEQRPFRIHHAEDPSRIIIDIAN